MSHDGYLIRMVGGTDDGVTRVVPPSWGWPLPDVLESRPGEDGYYRKHSESQLPADVDDKEGIMRGAEYHWVPA